MSVLYLPHDKLGWDPQEAIETLAGALEVPNRSEFLAL
jgi:hypothetical protein